MTVANKKLQAGRGLLETLVVLSLILMTLPILYKKMVTRMEETENAVIAAQMKAVQESVRQYIETHYGILTSTSFNLAERTVRSGSGSSQLFQPFPDPGRGDTTVIPMAQLSDFLPAGMFDNAKSKIRMKGKLYDDYIIAIRRERRDIGVAAHDASPEQYEILDNKVVSGIIFTKKAGRLQDVDTRMRAAHITGLLGFNAGVVLGDLNMHGPSGFINGNQGAWRINIPNIFSPSVFSDNYPQHGNVALIVYKGLADQLNKNVLYRQHIPGFPDANKMMTSIDMDGNNIVNIDEADARRIFAMHCTHRNPVTNACEDSITAVDFLGMDAGGLIRIFDIDGNPDDTTITIDGSTGEIRFTGYKEPFNPLTYRPGQATFDSEGALVAGGGITATESIPRDEYGRPMYGMRPDQTSIMKDVRVRATGGQLLSELMPKLSLMSVQRNLSDGDIITAPGFVYDKDTNGNVIWRRSLRPSDRQPYPTCPAGYVPTVSVRRSTLSCPTESEFRATTPPSLLDPKKRKEWFETLRCFWPNPNYLPLTTITVNTGAILISPENLRMPEYAVGLRTSNNGSFITPIGRATNANADPPRDRYQFVRTPNPTEHTQTALNSVSRASYLEKLGFSKVYNTIRCSILGEAGISGYCQGDALFLRFTEADIGQATFLKNRDALNPSLNFVGFEICQAAQIKVLQHGRDGYTTPFEGMKRVFVSPDCPMEEGWALLSKTPRCNSSPCTASSSGIYDQEPYHFIRVPIQQFSQIGRNPYIYEISGTIGENFIVETNPLNLPRSASVYPETLQVDTTVGWTLSVNGGQGVDAYVYCKYEDDSFDYAQ